MQQINNREPQATLRYSMLTPSDAEALAELFQQTSTPCYCRWYDFTGDKNAWLDRCYNRREENRADLIGATLAGEMRGVIARDASADERGERAGRVVGWMKLDEPKKLPKLYEQRIYKNLPCFSEDRSGILAIGCFLVDSSQRGRGIARGLLQTGVEWAKERGFRALEAFPRRDLHESRMGDELVWTGPFELYRELGFEVVNDFGPYPVLRKHLK